MDGQIGKAFLHCHKLVVAFHLLPIALFTMDMDDRKIWEPHWKAHGFIDTKEREVLWRKARKKTNKNGDLTQEYTSVELVEDILNKTVFTEPYFNTNSQYPLFLKKGSNQRIDVVEQRPDDQYEKRPFYLHEAKSVQWDTPAKLCELEHEILEYSQLYLEANSQFEFVYAGGSVGERIRLFSYNRGEMNLKPFWSGSSDKIENWYDVGNVPHAKALMEGYTFMKNMPLSGTDFTNMVYENIGTTSQRY